MRVLSPLAEPDRRPERRRARDGREQREPHDALQPAHVPVGPGALRVRLQSQYLLHSGPSLLFFQFSRVRSVNNHSILDSRLWRSFFGVPLDCLPAVRSSAEVFGCVSHEPLQGVPISGVRHVPLLFPPLLMTAIMRTVYSVPNAQRTCTYTVSHGVAARRPARRTPRASLHQRGRRQKHVHWGSFFLSFYLSFSHTQAHTHTSSSSSY